MMQMVADSSIVGLAGITPGTLMPEELTEAFI
jgi:hypothetical protein